MQDDALEPAQRLAELIRFDGQRRQEFEDIVTPTADLDHNSLPKCFA